MHIAHCEFAKERLLYLLKCLFDKKMPQITKNAES